MAVVSLGGGSKDKKLEKVDPKKQKVLFIGIPSIIKMIIDLKDCERFQPYAKAFVKNITTSMSKKELRKAISEACGVKTMNKMKRFKQDELKVLSDFFDPNLWS